MLDAIDVLIPQTLPTGYYAYFTQRPAPAARTLLVRNTPDSLDPLLSVRIDDLLGLLAQARGLAADGLRLVALGPLGCQLRRLAFLDRLDVVERVQGIGLGQRAVGLEVFLDAVGQVVEVRQNRVSVAVTGA